MIQVRVREDDRIDVARLDRERLPVSFAKFLETLKEAAVRASAGTLTQAISLFQGKSCVCYSLARFWGDGPQDCVAY
jgi:hypothetical protein